MIIARCMTYRCHRAHTRADAHLHERVYVRTIARNGAFHFHVTLDDEVGALFQNVERGTWRARWKLHNVGQVSFARVSWLTYYHVFERARTANTPGKWLAIAIFQEGSQAKPVSVVSFVPHDGGAPCQPTYVPDAKYCLAQLHQVTAVCHAHLAFVCKRRTLVMLQFRAALGSCKCPVGCVGHRQLLYFTGTCNMIQ